VAGFVSDIQFGRSDFQSSYRDVKDWLEEELSKIGPHRRPL